MQMKNATLTTTNKLMQPMIRCDKTKKKMQEYEHAQKRMFEITTFITH